MYTRKHLTETILAARYAESGGARTWRETAMRLYPTLEPNATGALLHKIATHPEYQPGPDVCRRLDLHEPRMAPPCPDCGEIHLIEDVCIAKCFVEVILTHATDEELSKVERRIRIRRKESVGIKRKRARASINLEDVESAARTISSKMTPEMVALLTRLLERGNA